MPNQMTYFDAQPNDIFWRPTQKQEVIYHVMIYTYVFLVP